MKNKKLIKILATIVSCLLLVGAVIGITAFAEETAPEIRYKNLAYEGTVQIVYYVDTNGLPEGYTVKLATWTEADKSDLDEKEAENFPKEVGGINYTIFTSNGIEPKKMRDTVYAQTVLYNGETEVDRGEIVEYSVYTYVNNRLNKNSTADQRSLYHALVDYGASVQKVLGYKTTKLVNDMFFDYEKVHDETENLKGTPSASDATLTRTLYKDAEGTWSATASADATEYVFTYLCNTDNIVNPDGTFTHQRLTTILSITEDGVGIPSVDVGSTTLSVGGIMPQAIADSGNDGLGGPVAGFYPQVLLKADNLVAVFETQMSISYRGYFRMNIGSVRENSFYDNNNAPLIEDRYGSLYVAGVNCSSFASRSSFNLRIVVSEDGNGGYKYSIYVNGNAVKENATFILPATILTTSKIVDRITILAASSGIRDAKMDLSDTTFVCYTTPEYNVNPVNKLDYNAQTTSPGNYETVYMNVSGSELVNATADAYDYAITYQRVTLAGPVNNGDGYFFGREKLISSVKNSAGEETTLTVGSRTYKAGSWLGERECWGYNGRDLDGDYFEFLANGAAAGAAPADDATLLYVWDTEMMVSPGTHAATQNIMVTYAAGGTSVPFESNPDYIRRAGGNAYYVFDDTAYYAAAVGEYFYVRIEIRDLCTANTNLDTSDNIADYDPVEIRFYLNGKLVATRVDEIDTTTAKYDTVPTQVRIESTRSTVDMSVTFANTYLDIYTAPKLDYTDAVLIGGNKTGSTYLNYNDAAGSYSLGSADSYTHKIDWKTGPYGTASASSYVWENNKVITAITDVNGETVDSITYSSKTYTVGSVIPRDPFGLTGSTFWGNGASLKFYPNATTDSANAPIFVFETDLVVEPISGNLSSNCFNIFVEGGASGTTGLANVTFAYDGGGSGFVFVCAASAGSNIGAQTKLDVRSGASYKEKIHVIIRIVENATDSSKMDISYIFSFTNKANAGDTTKSPFTTMVTVDKADVTRVAVTDVSTMRSVKATFTNTVCIKREIAE